MIGGLMVLVFEGVGRVYMRGAQEMVALEDISFALDRGECLAVYGLNRPGKTTLLQLAAGIDRPSSGSILFEGESYYGSACDFAELVRKQIAWVSRGPNPHLGLSVLDFVAASGLLESRSAKQAESEAREALSIAGIGKCAGAKFSKISDCEVRLAEIAQAIVKRPRLLVIDEPAVSLDEDERDRVLALLVSYALELGGAVLFSASFAEHLPRGVRLLHLSGGRESSSPRPHSAKVIELPVRGNEDDHAPA